MNYLLDTGPLAAYLRGRSGAVARLDGIIQQGEAATSILIYGEVMEYFQSFPNFSHFQGITRGLFYNRVKPLYLKYAIMERYGVLRRLMRAQGGLIGDVDTAIAATALEYGITIITTDNDYTRVPGLAVQIIDKADLR